MKNIEALILPDIHGRKFWKEAINKFPIDKYPNLQIVFLGDYLDPYESYDGISKSQALDNFKEILSLDDPRITLLIGNHDWHYFVNLDTCRIDYSNAKEIKKLFIDNISRFKVHTIIELDECKYLFTHAGITQKYLNDIASLAKYEYENWNPGNVDPNNDPKYKWIYEMSNIYKTYNFDLFEECLQNYNDSFYNAPLSMISRERGGWNPYGSPIWADVHEHLYNVDLPGFYQIFGHTMPYPTGPKDFAISPQGHCWSMLDASQAFILDIEGNIEQI